MFCKRCGKEILDSSTLCTDCATKEEEKRKNQRDHDEWRAQMAQKLNQKSPDSRTYAPASEKEDTAFCTNCGAKIDSKAAFCSSCGAKIGETAGMPPTTPELFVTKPALKNTIHTKKVEVFCPQCGSHDIDMQVHQEMRGSKTVTRTKSKYRQKRHGLLWWIFIGSWWWMIDLLLWIYLFPIRFLIQLFKKKDYTGTSKSVEKTQNKITYRTVFLCKNCGKRWEK